MLHPRVGDDDEERRHDRSTHGHDERGEVQLLGQAVPAEDPQSEESRLEEEGEQPLHRERGAEDVADEARVVAPGHAELKLLHDAGGDTHDEVDEVQLAPELRHAQVALFAGAHPEHLHDHDERAEAESEWHHPEVVDGRDAELPAGDFEGIHCVPFCGAIAMFRLVGGRDGP